MNLYGLAYRHALWPAYEAIRGRHSWRLWRLAERRQWWGSDQLREFQLAELRQLLKHAHSFTPWYHDRFEALGLTGADMNLPHDFERLPPISKDDIRQNLETMIASQHRGRLYEHKTGGSTGVPLHLYINYGSYEHRRAVTLRGYRWAGCEDGDRQFYLWGAPVGTPSVKQRLKTGLHHAFLRHEVFSSFRLSEPAMAECCNRINRFKPQTIVGYTNALYLLAQFIIAENKQLIYPNAVITAAEGVNAVQRQTIEKAFRAPVFASYGCREFMLIAMECNEHRGLHISADNLLVEVIRPDGRAAAEGEVGEILITDLHNFGMPMIRYKIGDMGVLSNRACPCGRGLPLLERVEGRVLDVIRTPDGRIVPGEFFPHLLKEFPAVKQFQVIQKTRERLEIKLVLREEDCAAQLRQIEQEIRKVLGPQVALDLQRVTEIPLTPSGKFRVTISELPATDTR